MNGRPLGLVESNADSPLESAIYEGMVRHRRLSPRKHEFRYSLFMLFLKLDELPRLSRKFWQLGEGRFNWARFKRADYLVNSDNPNGALEDAVLQKMNDLNKDKKNQLQGDVYLLGNLRYLGFYFNPLNLYFLKQGLDYTHMLAEVSNTPWNQRHYYLIDLSDIKPSNKEFHVSPFNPMSQCYHWHIVPPDDSGKFSLHVENHDLLNKKEKVFDATLALHRCELNQKQLNRVLLKSPSQTLGILIGIYWQAFKLVIKRLPIYPHSRNTKTQSDAENRRA